MPGSSGWAGCVSSSGDESAAFDNWASAAGVEAVDAAAGPLPDSAAGGCWSVLRDTRLFDERLLTAMKTVIWACQAD